MSQHPNLPVLDHAILDQLHEMVDSESEPNFFEDLVTDFFHDAELMIRVIGGRAADRPARRRAAHSLKSTSAMLGASRLSNIAAAVERRFREGKDWDPKEIDLMHELAKVQEALGAE